MSEVPERRRGLSVIALFAGLVVIATGSMIALHSCGASQADRPHVTPAIR